MPSPSAGLAAKGGGCGFATRVYNNSGPRGGGNERTFAASPDRGGKGIRGGRRELKVNNQGTSNLHSLRRSRRRASQQRPIAQRHHVLNVCTNKPRYAAATVAGLHTRAGL